MSLQVEKLEKNMAKLTIEVPAGDFEKALQSAYNKQKKNISVPGFRKGKVPRQMVEKMYGPEIFYDDAANELIPTAYEEELKGSELEIVSRPVIDIEQIQKGEAFIFTAEVALKPEVTLGEYKGLEVDAVSVEVTPEEVEEKIKEEAEKNARTITVEDRGVQDGDDVILDFEGFVDGEAFEGGKSENYPLTIGSGSFIPGFEEQLIGAEAEKELEVNVTFPEDYHAEELKGKAALFKCTVKEIKEKELPELDDEFASEVSEFETLAEYKEDIKKNLSERKAQEAKRAKEDAVIDAIINDSDIEIPEPMLETEQRHMADDFGQRIQMQGINLEQYFQITGSSYDTLVEQIKPQAEKRIKSRLVLEAVAAKEGIEVSEEEYVKETERMAEIYQMEAEKVREMLGEKEKKQVMKDLAIQKAVDFVVENAKEK